MTAAALKAAADSAPPFNPQFEQSWQRVTQGPFVPNYLQIWRAAFE